MNNIRLPQVAIIDYKMGNLFSVKRACEFVGLNPVITDEIDVLMGSDAVILPGVGSFGDAINNLKSLHLISPIKEFIASGKPFFGICLGMQLLLSESEEFGNHKGLDIIEGHVVRFTESKGMNEITKIPHVGWNKIFCPQSSPEEFWNNSPLQGIKNGEYMYFVHSYYAVPSDKTKVFSLTDYIGTIYCSSIASRNIFASQFHPEKSASEGIKIYKNWAMMIKDRRSA